MRKCWVNMSILKNKVNKTKIQLNAFLKILFGYTCLNSDVTNFTTVFFILFYFTLACFVTVTSLDYNSQSSQRPCATSTAAVLGLTRPNRARVFFFFFCIGRGGHGQSLGRGAKASSCPLNRRVSRRIRRRKT